MDNYQLRSQYQIAAYWSLVGSVTLSVDIKNGLTFNGSIPACPGVYKLCVQKTLCAYIGEGQNLHKRMQGGLKRQQRNSQIEEFRDGFYKSSETVIALKFIFVPRRLSPKVDATKNNCLLITNTIDSLLRVWRLTIYKMIGL